MPLKGILEVSLSHSLFLHSIDQHYSIRVFHSYRMYKRSVKRVQYPCTVCSRESGDGTIQCSGCGDWTHADCLHVDEEYLQRFSEVDFYCPCCATEKGEFRWDMSIKRYILITHVTVYIHIFIFITCAFCVLLGPSVLWKFHRCAIRGIHRNRTFYFLSQQSTCESQQNESSRDWTAAN